MFLSVRGFAPLQESLWYYARQSWPMVRGLMRSTSCWVKGHDIAFRLRFSKALFSPFPHPTEVVLLLFSLDTGLLLRLLTSLGTLRLAMLTGRFISLSIFRWLLWWFSTSRVWLQRSFFRSDWGQLQVLHRSSAILYESLVSGPTNRRSLEYTNFLSIHSIWKSFLRFRLDGRD